jgi:hypothetical protein
VPAVPTPGKAHIPDYAHEPTAWNQNAEAVPPDLIELVVKGIVISDEPQLALVERIFL